MMAARPIKLFLAVCVASAGVLALHNVGHAAPMAPAGAKAQAPPSLLTEVEIKCGKTDDGRFVCQNVKKSKKNKCAGPNDCGKGYRDLEKPNRYGACCEQIKGGSDGGAPDEKPKNDAPQSGACRQVEQMSQMSCRPPFDAISCGPVQNGKMTCCCVK